MLVVYKYIFPLSLGYIGTLCFILFWIGFVTFLYTAIMPSMDTLPLSYSFCFWCVVFV